MRVSTFRDTPPIMPERGDTTAGGAASRAAADARGRSRADEPQQRVWTINGRFLTQRMTGVQRYAREIVLELDRMIAQGHPLTRSLSVELVAPAAAPGLPGLTAIRVRSVPGLTGHLWEQLTLARVARGGILSLGNTSTLLRRRQIVCIHDLNVFLFPQSYSRSFRLLYRIVLPLLGRLSRRVVTVSRFSSAAIVEAGVARADKVTIAPNGHDHVRRWQHSSASDANPHPDTVVVLGSLAPHKNVATLLRIAPDLMRHGLRLAIVGNRDTKIYGDAKLDRAGEAALWLGPITDEALAALLSRSLCLAFPSLMEGFGLPPIEAMALGCPVVVSDRASLPETCGDAALYASALAPDEWLAQILRLQRDTDLRREMIQRGRARAETYSWRASAEVFLRAMADVDGETAS